MHEEVDDQIEVFVNRRTMLVEIEATIDGNNTYNILFDDEAAPKTKRDEKSKAKPSPHSQPLPLAPKRIICAIQPRRTNSYIRVEDLRLSDENMNLTGSKQSLISLDGSGLGPVMSGLVNIGIEEATDESSRWTAVSSTESILSKRNKSEMGHGKIKGMGSWKNAAYGKDVLVWHSKCTRQGHGSEHPIVRSRGIIPASAAQVVDLLRDSSKVMEYNKMSVGREDQHVLTQKENSSVHSLDKCPFLGVSGEAKIMSSKSQPPLVRKPLEFKTLFYARRLEENDGVEFDGVAYITVGRSVWEGADGTTGGNDATATRCEILLSVNLIREVIAENHEKWCELTNISHGVSPGLPMFMVRQVGLMAAENFIKDIRGVFE